MKEEIHQLVGEIFSEVLSDITSFQTDTIRTKIMDVGIEIDSIVIKMRSLEKDSLDDIKKLATRKKVLLCVKEALRTIELHIEYRKSDDWGGLRIQNYSPEVERIYYASRNVERLNKKIKVGE